MLFGEPPPTQADLNFRVLGIPVRVHPFFWLVGLFLIAGSGMGNPPLVALWMFAFFISILVHEMGHALAARSYGYQPWITLHGMGGLASYQPTRETVRSKVLITAAGPGAGFAFAGAIVLLLIITGHPVAFVVSVMPVRYEVESPYVDFLIGSLLFINIYWGVINLFPVYPLDGGQIARELLIEMNPRDGLWQSLVVSMIAAAALALYAFKEGSIFMAIMFGYMGFLNFQMFESARRGGGGDPW